MARRVLICGSRGFDDYELARRELDRITQHVTQEIVVVSGTARGGDMLGERWARERGHRIERYPADWDRYGRSAGYRRNEQMVDTLLEGDAVVALWDGQSRGTLHTVTLAKRRPELYVYVVQSA